MYQCKLYGVVPKSSDKNTTNSVDEHLHILLHRQSILARNDIDTGLQTIRIPIPHHERIDNVKDIEPLDEAIIEQLHLYQIFAPRYQLATARAHRFVTYERIYECIPQFKDTFNTHAPLTIGEQIRVWRHIPPPNYKNNFYTQYNDTSIPIQKLLVNKYIPFLFPQRLSIDTWEPDIWDPLVHYYDIITKSYSMYTSYLENSARTCNLSIQDLGVDTLTFQHAHQRYINRVNTLRGRSIEKDTQYTLPDGRQWVMQHTQRPIQQHEGSSTSPQKFTLTSVGENYENFLRFQGYVCVYICI